ncbi:MAG: acetate/propionate family kinase [Deltaproteobacteria bacterium]|nr:acetate/propionate family kinase [Deltaproteobacteria bacterium]
MPEAINIISVNCGSSSIKFSIFKILEKSVKNNPLLNIERTGFGKIEEIGTPFGEYHFETKNKNYAAKLNFKNHIEAINFMLRKLGLHHNSSNSSNIKIKEFRKNGLNASALKIDIVAHRFVNGGKYFNEPIIASKKNIVKLSKLDELAPLHNPSSLKGLEIMAEYMPNAKQVCIFDTAFHKNIPLCAKLYPIPIDYYIKYNIKKFGFHGISYSYINEILNLNRGAIKKIAVCHLGNGASICAIKNGASIDTSMGYTPLEGLMMGTRSGNLDPSIPFILQEKLNISGSEMYNILNKKSGVLGISGKTYDFKELLNYKDKYSKLAFKMYAYRVIKFIGQYAASMNGLDALVFTGGIGENSSLLRKEVGGNLSYLGIKIDNKKNKEASQYFQTFNAHGKIKVNKSIKSIGTGKTPVFVIHTDEERQMASEALNLVF